MGKKYFIAGGAGFIGSHLARAILKEEKASSVVIYDNFSSGRLRHLGALKGDRRLKIVKADIKDTGKLSSAMKGAGIVYHLASNPDISKAMTRPDIDFWEGTYLTNNVLEAMRTSGAGKILYASGSGIYGDTGFAETNEDYPFKYPISTYGASKLSGEALISSYCHMFNMSGSALRFANVVGPCQTHGVGYDFIRKLRKDPRKLPILGDGSQSKSYIYVSDVISAMRLLEDKAPKGFCYYNVATTDNLTVKQIADIAVDMMGLKDVKYGYTGGDRGWKGDVPVVKMNSDKIRSLGWKNRYTSAEAMKKAVKAMLEDIS